MALDAFLQSKHMTGNKGNIQSLSMTRGLSFKELSLYLFIANLENNNLCYYTIRLFKSKRGGSPILNFNHIQNLYVGVSHRSVIEQCSWKLLYSVSTYCKVGIWLPESVSPLPKIWCFKICESNQLLCLNLKSKRNWITYAQSLEGRRPSDLCEITYENRCLEL